MHIGVSGLYNPKGMLVIYVGRARRPKVEKSNSLFFLRNWAMFLEEKKMDFS